LTEKRAETEGMRETGKCFLEESDFGSVGCKALAFVLRFQLLKRLWSRNLGATVI